MCDKENVIHLLKNIKEETKPIIILGPAGEIFRFTRRNQNTGGLYVLAKSILPPGAGPLPHIHHLQNEWFYTPKAGISLFMGTDNHYRDVTLIPGITAPKDHINVIDMKDNDLLHGSPHVIHGLVNNSNENLELYFIWARAYEGIPNMIFEYFDYTGKRLETMNTREKPSQISKYRFISAATKFCLNNSTSFWDYASSVGFNEEMKISNDYNVLEKILIEGEKYFD